MVGVQGGQLILATTSNSNSNKQQQQATATSNSNKQQQQATGGPKLDISGTPMAQGPKLRLKDGEYRGRTLENLCSGADDLADIIMRMDCGFVASLGPGPR